ncbi:Rrf2 family transcriptional regulator [Serinicoccus chungangensis]|uniref:Rrf2 family transcriptional regulator n=1 Tax=Serinicoccus chungangensis TaxID=767452 RepID=A0A0W8I124_9MICO|nr:Rrf2 family transcriptional regulator [Serinicoccus chungangensis]KUG51112.1 Rrf2 family transcriptional regulator [Serinicoccus chungangensis]
MDISARSDYAVRAMLALAAGQGGQDGQDEPAAREATPVSVDRLAQAQDLPVKFLEAIVADLRRAGLVASRRGARGGYLLARPAAEIAVGDVIRAVDGPLAEVRGLRPHDTAYPGEAQHLPALWVATRAALRAVLDGTSLDQLRHGAWPAEVTELLRQPDAWESR